MNTGLILGIVVLIVSGLQTVLQGSSDNLLNLGVSSDLVAIAGTALGAIATVVGGIQALLAKGSASA